MAISSETWAPLRNGVFRAIYLAVLVSNIGLWMQTVGAQWLVVDQPNAEVLVALVQAMVTLPVLLFAVVGGALADIFDRRRLLIFVQVALVIVGALLTALTWANQMPPALLLAFTFFLGAGPAFTTPAYQALIPELVPREQLPSASALGSISINLGRAVGPAIAGVLIAKVGVAAVFALNTLTLLFYAIVVAFWREPKSRPSDFPEQFLSAMRAGAQYVRFAPVVRRILFRSALFLVPASMLWALLPLVANQQLGLGATGYGLLLGSLGVGAVLGAFLLPVFRSGLDNNGLLVLASIVYAVALIVIVFVPNTIVVLVVLLPAGVAWVIVLSSVNAALQLFLPSWVRGRGLAIYQTVLFGAQAAGAILAGVIAAPFGIGPTFLVASAVLLAGAATTRWRPLIDTRGLDRGAAVYWPEPHLAIEVEPEAGPVLVMRTYTVAPETAARFISAMDNVRGSRRRTGATQWGLFHDGDIPGRFVEVFVVPSWEEHMRQHDGRLTGTDRAFEEQADALSDPPPTVAHLIATHEAG